MKDKKILLISFILGPVLFFGTLFFGTTTYHYDFNLNLDQKYNPTDAITFGRTIAEYFPLKAIGGPDHDVAGAWIKSKLESWGYTVQEQHFKNIIDSKTQAQTNYIVKAGNAKESIAIFSNYDQAASTVQAASDTSAAVGVTMALAKMLSNETNTLKRSVVFVFLDGEEWGMFGAKEFVKTYNGNIVASLDLEDIHIGEIQYIELSNSGQYGGYAPLWLRELYIQATQAHGMKVQEPVNVNEFIDRSLEISFQDQGPINYAKIPCLTALSIGDNEKLARQVYHLPGDTWDLMSNHTIQVYGQIAETAMRTLASLDKIPHESTTYLKTSQGRYLSGTLILFACIILFLPVYTAVFIQIKKLNKKSLEELKHFTRLYGTFLVMYGILKLLAFTKVIPRFDLYPAHPKNSLLYHPDYVIMGIFAVATALLLFEGYKFSKDHWQANREDHLAMLTLLYGLIVILGLINNIYATALFLIFPTYIWLPVIFFGKSTKKWIWIALPIGYIIHILLVVQYAAIIFLKFEMIWYLFLALGNHLFPTQVFLLFLGTMTFIIRASMIIDLKSTCP